MEKESHQTGTPQIKVLMYHRVDTIDTDPWGICVAPEVFEAQVKYLTSHYPIISVPEAVAQITSGRIKEQSICITFDDGYADNYVYAKPILEKYNCPATFFIPTAFIGATQPFWWDELEYIFLHLPQLPLHLSLSVNGRAYDYTISDGDLTNTQLDQHKNWKWYNDPPTDRCAVFLAVWESLRPLPHLAIEEQLAVVRAWASSQAPANFRAPMDGQQLQHLFQNSLFTAGLHTHTHPDLSTKEKEAQIAEIKQGERVLATQYNLDCNYLAYPYGRYNDATLAAVKDLGMTTCFTTDAAAIDAGTNRNTVGRYQVCNWNMEAFKNELAL